MAASLDVVAFIDRFVVPNLVPLLVALVALFLGTLALFAALRSADSSKVAGITSKELKAYTREEVAKHNSPEDCWVMIKLQQYNGLRVFDLSSYVDDHPGGEAIFRNAGQDVTKGFFGPHHPPRAHDMIEDFMIGTLVDE